MGSNNKIYFIILKQYKEKLNAKVTTTN